MSTFTNKQLLLAFSFLFSANAFAQSGLNTTQKSIFKAAKQIAIEDNNTVVSLMMILIVLIIVGIALYLSFKDDRLKPTI